MLGQNLKDEGMLLEFFAAFLRERTHSFIAKTSKTKWGILRSRPHRIETTARMMACASIRFAQVVGDRVTAPTVACNPPRDGGMTLRTLGSQSTWCARSPP